VVHCFAPDTKLVYIHNYGGVALRNGNKCRSPYPLRIAPIVKTLVLRFGLTPDGVRCVVPLIATILFAYGRHVAQCVAPVAYERLRSIVAPALRYSQVVKGVCPSMCIQSKVFKQFLKHRNVARCGHL